MSYTLKSIFATLPKTERGRPIVIGGDPKGKNFLYVNGNSVIIRDLANPSISEYYTQHSQPTTCAKYSPSGFYIASADITGKVRIWDTINKEHILKNEFQPLGGPIKDLAWSGDSQRIVVGGDGRERFAHVFNADTGTSVGEIMGQSKAINAVDFRSTRPFRIVTASEDNTLAFFHGPPFKFQFTNADHTRFVNCVRYSPDCETFTSGSADFHAFIFDGKTGEKKGELGAPAHKGGIYGLCYSPDSKQIVSVSADKTAKIWDVASGSIVQEFAMGTATEDMQVGCLWQGDFLITVSLSGHINYLDIKSNSVWRSIKGHNKPITALAVSEDKTTAYTAASDGGVCQWNVNSGENAMFGGKGHSNQVQGMKISGDELMTVAMDDSAIISSLSSGQYGQAIKMPSQPRGLATAEGGLAVVACANEVVVLRHGRVVFSQHFDFEPTCAAIHPGQTDVAVGGGAGDQKVHIYSLNGDTLVEKTVLPHLGDIFDMGYSPDGSQLCACDTNRKVYIYQMPNYEATVTTEWGFHTARVNTLAWASDSRHVATGALDTNMIVWGLEKKNDYILIKGAHPQSNVTKVEWLDNNTLITVGHDSSVRQWSITHNV